MNIIILTEKDSVTELKYEINDERFQHIKNVLKLKTNDVVKVGFINASTGTAKIVKLNKNNALLEIVSLNEELKVSNNVDIICALPRPQTLKKVLNTCATMGVSNLYLIRSEKVEKSYFHSTLLKEENYNKFLIEGLSQGKRTNLTKVSVHNRFKGFFEKDFNEICENSICLLAHPNSKSYLNEIKIEKFQKVILAIGPEGGWNEFEINLMEEKGFIKYKLSENILRVENALTAALSQIEMLFAE